MLGWYFLGAAVAAGSAISSGLFVPMLLMGAILGRLVGLATTDIADTYGQVLSSKWILHVPDTTSALLLGGGTQQLLQFVDCAFSNTFQQQHMSQ
jgi:H+/Cl- antiporter ClcA